jgi:MFS transporter, DHA3 family, macrolide efflux protein
MDDHQLIPDVASTKLLANLDLRALTLAQFTALVGTFAIYFASMALVEQVTKSSAQVGLMIFSSTLPGFLFGVIAGPIVDKQDKAMVIKWGCALRVPIGILFALLMMISLPNADLIWVVYIANFLISALAQFQVAAEYSVIPRYVGRDQLMAANSLFNLSSLLSQGVGMVVVAPALLKLGGAGLVGWFSAALYLLSWVFVIRLPKTGVEGQEHSSVKRTVQTSMRTLWSELHEGWRFIVRDRSVTMAVIQLTLVSTTTLMLGTIAPGFANRILHTDVANAVVAAVPIGLGFLSGMWVVSGPHGARLSRETWSVLGLTLFGAGLAGVTVFSLLDGRGLIWMGLMAIAAGFGFAVTIIPARTLLQERPPVRMRGRIISTQLVLGNAASTLPMPIAGGLADLLGIRKVMALIAAVVLLVAGVSAYSHHKG